MKLNRLEKKNSVSWELIIFCFVIVMGFLDFTNDFAISRPINDVHSAQVIIMPQISSYVQIITTCLFCLMVLKAILNLLLYKTSFFADEEIKIFLLLFISINIYGTIIGWLKGVNPIYIVGDFRNIIAYSAVFSIVDAFPNKRLIILRNVIFACGGILVIKVFLGYVVHYLTFGYVGWRSLLKLYMFFAPVFFIAYCGFLDASTLRKKIIYLCLSLLGAFGIFAVQTRGLFMGVGVGFVFALFFFVKKNNIKRLSVSMGLVLLLGLFMAIILSDDKGLILGDWKSDNFLSGLEFRREQAGMLWEQFSENWLFGAGLGAFNSTYDFYADNPRPYLVELEFLNLFSKLGLIGMMGFFISFFCLIVGCINGIRRAACPDVRSFVAGLGCGLVAMIIASISNTGYSSIYFHLYIVVLLLTLSDIKRQNTEGVITG